MPLRAAPGLGKHTGEVLRSDLGLSDTELGRLKDAGVIAPAEE